MKIRCWHSDSWVREDNMEICSSCGKELGKLVNKGNKSLSSFSGTPKEASKPVESQQNLDNYVLQSNLEDNFSQKEKKYLSSFSGTPKEASKPVASQQSLDSYVAQSTLENNSEDKENVVQSIL